MRSIAISLVALLGLSCAPVSSAVTRPNVVVIMTDDQRPETLTPATMPATWQRVVLNGARFTSAFTTTGVCCPARLSFLTGALASRHGMHGTKTPELSIGPDGDTLATRLQAAGYRTGCFGKYIQQYHKLGPPYREAWYVPPGWTTGQVFAPPGYLNYDLVEWPTGVVTHYGFEEESYSTDVLAQLARAFVAQALEDGVPFFVLVTPYAPHEGDLRVPARHQGLWASLPPWRPLSYGEPDVSDKASVMQLPLADEFTRLAIDENRIEQYESLRAVDEMIQSIFLAIPKLKRRDTIFVVTSDNGFNWYEHRLRHAVPDDDPTMPPAGKNYPYDESHRIPLVIHYPAVLGSQARTEGGLMTLQDLTSTIASWTLGTPFGPDGIDESVALRLRLPLLRTTVPLEGWSSQGVPFYTATRTATQKTIRWATGEEEHYDLTSDPLELNSHP